MRTEEFGKVIEIVRIMHETLEEASNVENYVNGLYAHGKITSRQFELLNRIIYS